MKKFKQYLNESDKHYSHFIDYVCTHLGIKCPKVTLVHDKQKAKEHKSFGGYNPSVKSIEVNVAGRHKADVMRTLAHELVHHKQDTEKRLKLHSEIGRAHV